MNIKQKIVEPTVLLSLLMIAIGVIFILVSHSMNDGLFKRLIESFGILFSSVFFVSILYEVFLAEKHFSQFDSLMITQFKQMDNIQSSCIRSGIQEIFETRNKFETTYPLISLLSSVKPNGRILVIARSMFHFFNKADAIKKALEKGGHLEIACISHNQIDKTLSEICFLKPSDMKTPLEVLNDDLLNWIMKEKPKGTLELRVYKQPLPDSIFYAELENRNIIIWDMTFGRDLSQKRVFVLEPSEGNLGKDLLKRYETIWNFGEVQLKFKSNGDIEINSLSELIKKYE